MADDFDPQRTSWVLAAEDLGFLEAAIADAAEIVADLETTGTAEHAVQGGVLNAGIGARVVLASLTLPTPEDQARGVQADTWVVPLSHPSSPWLGHWRAVLRRIAQAVLTAEAPFTNQNVGFDAKWIQATTGVDLTGRIGWDTQQSAMLLDETRSTKLKDRAPETFGIESWSEFDLEIPGEAERVPLFDLGMYAARDTYWTWRLALAHRRQMFVPDPGVEADHEHQPESSDEVTDARLGRLAVWVAMPMVATLTRVVQRGIRLDVDWTRNQLAEDTQRAAELSEELSHRYDGLPGNPDPQESNWYATSHWFRDWTRMAVSQGDLVVGEITDNGNPRWSKEVLVRQVRAGSEVADKLLALRTHTKKAEYLASWLHFVTDQERIHTTYYTARVVTGRLSSAEPNMQQVTASLRPAFVPSPGCLIADFDYSQIELRIAAQVSQCRPMIEAFQRGDDLHRLLAARITGKSPAEVTAYERQAGKSANFGLLYEQSWWGFRFYAETNYGVSFTAEEAQQVHRTFFATWDGIAEWHRKSALRAHQTGQVVSPIGRVRRLPEIFDGNPEKVGYAERVAVNAPVQGYASDLMQVAAASIEGLLPGHQAVPGARIVATVHDDIVVEIPTDGWREVVAAVMARMLNLNPVLLRLGARLDVPLEVEVKVGTRWGLDDVARLTSKDVLGTRPSRR